MTHFAQWFNQLRPWVKLGDALEAYTKRTKALTKREGASDK